MSIKKSIKNKINELLRKTSLSIREISASENISYNTVRRWSMPFRPEEHSGRKLCIPKEIDDLLAQYVRAKCNDLFRYSLRGITCIVNKCLKKLRDEGRIVPKCVSTSWARRFAKRHHFVQRKEERISKKIIDKETAFEIEKFYDDLRILNQNNFFLTLLSFEKNMLNLFLSLEYNFSLNQIYNMDETSFSTIRERHVLSDQGERRASSRDSERLKNITGCITICADGTYIDPMFLIPSTSIYASQIEKFDCSTTHHGQGEMELEEKNHVIIRKIPKHTTSEVLPLDVSFFAPLKNEYYKLLDEFEIPLLNSSNYMDYVYQTYSAFRNIASPGRIEKCFAYCSLIPPFLLSNILSYESKSNESLSIKHNQDVIKQVLLDNAKQDSTTDKMFDRKIHPPKHQFISESLLNILNEESKIREEYKIQQEVYKQERKKRLLEEDIDKYQRKILKNDVLEKKIDK